MKIRDDYTCPLELVHDIIKGKWKTIILYQMKDGPKGLAELEREIEGITQKMLLEQLKELIEFGLVEKKTFEGYPLRVEYSLTDRRGRKMIEAINIMQMIGVDYMLENGMTEALVKKGILSEQGLSLLEGDKPMTRSKRPGMKCSLDVLYDHTIGFSKYINDKSMYKIVLIRSGSFVYEDEGKYRLVTAPAVLALSEKADFKILSEREVESRTVLFRPSVIREEFTFDAINSGMYDKFLSAATDDGEMSEQEKMEHAIDEDLAFEYCFSNNMVYQDALYVSAFLWSKKDILHYALTRQEYDTLRRLFLSIEYEINEQPDNFWILRTRYFITSILFMNFDFYRNDRQDDIYENPLVARVCRYFWDKLSDEITLADVLKEFSVNKNTLNEAFYKELDMSCMAYLEQMRINIAKRFLQISDYSIAHISMMCGYTDTNYFSKVFKKHMGVTPSEFQKSMKE